MFAADVEVASVAKHGEELCGDNVEILKTEDSTTIILSDGLGSGVKASILATMTTKIAFGLLKRNVGLEVVFETIADTLPVCKVRGLAYSTLTIVQVNSDGFVKLIEYENPPVIVLRNRKPLELNRTERIIGGKKVQESGFQMLPTDILLLVSDGVVHAGVGGLFKLGLGFEGLMKYLPNPEETDEFAQVFVSQIIELADTCYLGKPGDDSTAVVLKLRNPRKTVVLTGPPLKRDSDSDIVARFVNSDATTRVVCGGTTGNMVGRELGEKVQTCLKYEDPSVPPVAVIKGIDLTTEGVLTLNRTLDRLRQYAACGELPLLKDGATLFTKTLLKSDRVSFWVGQAQNPAHANLDQLVQLSPRTEVIRRISNLLKSLGKETDIEYF